MSNGMQLSTKSKWDGRDRRVCHAMWTADLTASTSMRPSADEEATNDCKDNKFPYISGTVTKSDSEKRENKILIGSMEKSKHWTLPRLPKLWVINRDVEVLNFRLHVSGIKSDI